MPPKATATSPAGRPGNIDIERPPEENSVSSRLRTRSTRTKAATPAHEPPTPTESAPSQKRRKAAGPEKDKSSSEPGAVTVDNARKTQTKGAAKTSGSQTGQSSSAATQVARLLNDKAESRKKEAEKRVAPPLEKIKTAGPTPAEKTAERVAGVRGQIALERDRDQEDRQERARHGLPPAPTSASSKPDGQIGARGRLSQPIASPASQRPQPVSRTPLPTPSTRGSRAPSKQPRSSAPDLHSVPAGGGVRADWQSITSAPSARNSPVNHRARGTGRRGTTRASRDGNAEQGLTEEDLFTGREDGDAAKKKYNMVAFKSESQDTKDALAKDNQVARPKRGGRAKKPGPRTASGRPSRAIKDAPREYMAVYDSGLAPSMVHQFYASMQIFKLDDGQSDLLFANAIKEYLDVLVPGNSWEADKSHVLYGALRARVVNERRKYGSKAKDLVNAVMLTVPASERAAFARRAVQSGTRSFAFWEVPADPENGIRSPSGLCKTSYILGTLSVYIKSTKGSIFQPEEEPIGPLVMAYLAVYLAFKSWFKGTDAGQLPFKVDECDAKYKQITQDHADVNEQGIFRRLAADPSRVRAIYSAVYAWAGIQPPNPQASEDEYDCDDNVFAFSSPPPESRQPATSSSRQRSSDPRVNAHEWSPSPEPTFPGLGPAHLDIYATPGLRGQPFMPSTHQRDHAASTPARRVQDPGSDGEDITTRDASPAVHATVYISSPGSSIDLPSEIYHDSATPEPMAVESATAFSQYLGGYGSSSSDSGSPRSDSAEIEAGANGYLGDADVISLDSAEEYEYQADPEADEDGEGGYESDGNIVEFF
ncbi:unnamed protein product [Peniophora sp. CBMAI 1063]|nr:unnamed protein product [Peniophora sp. CBMAI 1063]